MNPAWDNAILATMQSPFLADLSRSVGNGDNDHAAATRYWLTICGASDNPWPAWDANIYALERIGECWPVMRHAADILLAQDVLPRLARFVCDRWQAAMDEGSGWAGQGITRAVVLAERAHDLVGLMHAGVKLTGSADPFALRRMAKHWIAAAVLP